MTIPMERVENRILTIRAHRVMLDADLAVLYGVTTGALNQAVKRNAERFPGDFMFRLTAEEGAYLKSQIVISNGWGGRRRSLPLAFTEQGVSMLSGVLKSPRAVKVNGSCGVASHATAWYTYLCENLFSGGGACRSGT